MQAGAVPLGRSGGMSQLAAVTPLLWGSCHASSGGDVELLIIEPYEAMWPARANRNP